jgi:hypothetical protein
VQTITIASDDGNGWSVADRSPMQVLLFLQLSLAIAFACCLVTLMQALHNSRTKTRNSSVHETITAYRLWYR